MVNESLTIQLKEASDAIEVKIKSAKAGLRTASLEHYQVARMKVQEAIAELLVAD